MLIFEVPVLKVYPASRNTVEIDILSQYRFWTLVMALEFRGATCIR